LASFKKYLTSTLFYVYDFLKGGNLNLYYKLAKEANCENHQINEKEVSAYLKKWGINEPLALNPLLSKSDLRNLASKVNEKRVKSWAYTGGSYGEPLRVPYSSKRVMIRTATFKYFGEKAGYSLGDSIVVIRAKSKSSFVQFLRNEMVIKPFNVSENNLENIIKLLIDKKVVMLFGYPTVMYDLALLLKRNPEYKTYLSIKNLVSVSEMLAPEKRAVVKNQFGCNFIDRYSIEEVGLIAQQKEYNGEYFLNKFGIFTEVLDPITLKPVKTGELGKVVVTDLNNDLVPLVRYDTGDLAIAGEYIGDQLQTIRRIEGRTAEKITNTEGTPISSLVIGPSIYKPLAKEGYLVQFQLAQIAKTTYELRTKITYNPINNQVLEKIESNLRQNLGRDAKIIIKEVNEIKAQPSGKRPMYKNEIPGSC